MPLSRRIQTLAIALALTVSACSSRDRQVEAQAGMLTVSQQQRVSWERNFNPLLPPDNTLFPTAAGVYEPLIIYNKMKGVYVPWLATGYEWSDDNLKLTFRTRSGVEWSDGRPFSARDVAFTFGLLQKHRAFDLQNVWGFLSGVSAPDDTTVEFAFKRPYVPGLVYLGHQPIVPEHVWKDIADPVTFMNPEPVATGPFPVVKTFRNQIYELERNPRYWQPGKPGLKGLRFPAYPNNDQAALALVTGKIDWAGNFVPAVERTFVARDPEHHRYWFPLVQGTVMLYANTRRPPFDDVRVRKAISMALDRELIVKVAFYEYTRPADAIGLSDAYARWRNQAAISRGTWVKHNPSEAERLLDEAGLKRGPDGVRLLPDGKRMKYEINVVTGWSDWVRAVQIMAAGLSKVGIEASLQAYDFGAWFEMLQKAEFDLSIGWTNEGPTPYSYYRDLMSSQTLKPVGVTAAVNWHRFGLREADVLFDRFERTSDEKTQHELSDGLQSLFVEHAPSIPIVLSPSWGECNTSRVVGFPDSKDPYAPLTPNVPPDYLLVLSELRPR